MTTTVPPPETLLQRLDKTSFFEHFTTFEKKRLVGYEKHFQIIRKNVTFIVEGKAGDCLYVLLSGQVRLVKQQMDLGDMTDGEVLGEMAFLANTQRTSSVMAVEDVLVFRIDQPLMKKLSSTLREKIKDQCIARLLERLDVTERRLKAHGLL